jgi:Immunity protein 35/Acetyltransferase (GNAT) family
LTERMAIYDEVAAKGKPPAPHYYLGVIGVHPDMHGRGVGTQLLESFCDLSRSDPLSSGVYLETAEESNLRFYERAGFAETGRGSLGPATLWCMYLPHGRPSFQQLPFSTSSRSAPEVRTMLDRQQADQLVAAWLEQHEIATMDFESPLPRHDERHVQNLVVVRVDEHEFGWVYFYDGSRHVQTGSVSDAVVGNAPLIVDRADGNLYITGTTHPIEHYLDEFRRGIRTPA